MKIRANGVETHYELTGPKDAPVVTLSNSLMSNLSMWDRQMAALKGYRVLRYDTRGHGGSEAVAGAYSFGMLADDVCGLLDALEIETTHFVGLSMGGMTGQGLAIHHPDRLNSLALCDTRGHSPELRKGQRDARIQVIEEHGVEPLVESALERWFSDGFRAANPDIMDGIRAMIRSTSPEGVIGSSHALNAHNYTPRLHEISAPTVIIVGEDDQGTPVSESEAMHERIAGSTLHVLPVARHLSNIECADAFNTILIDFLESV